MTPTTLTTELVAELRRLMAEATPGPWFWIDSYTVTNEAHDSVTGNIYSRQLITLAVNALPALLAAAEREAKMREALERLANAWDYAPYGTAHHITTCNQAATAARAVLAEGGAK
jgi:hypothetical protein